MARTVQADKAILAAARELVARRPASEVSMEAVAAAAGFSRQAIYRHFGSRAGLLTALLASIDEVEGAREQVEHVLAAATGRACLERLVAWWTDYVPRFVGTARGVLAAKHADADLRVAWDDRMRALHDVGRAVAERCRADGTLAPDLSPAEAADALWALLSVPLWIQLREDAGWSAERYREHTTALAVARLVGPP
ncbi:MAG TPA: helix-turn-helix domain-containing protein [Conexibacter sp.]|jgi:AcrR family transcriptional regulator|nr:helix-turn-helix domain-containing protein [Conexibacter sp.]